MFRSPKLEYALQWGRCKEAALAYAEIGWAVFPCKPKGKAPLTQHGFKDATTDPKVIEDWWDKHPNANVAIRTGSASGLLVIDVDPKNGGAETLKRLEEKYGHLPVTWTVTTPSGGTHFYFKYPEGYDIPSSASKFGKGIDIRAERGYVVAPPSVLHEGQYRLDRITLPVPAPEWLITLLVEQTERPKLSGSAALYSNEPIFEGTRNVTLASIAGSLRRRGFEREEIEVVLKRINEDRCIPPLPEKEVESVAKSISRYPPDGEKVTVVSTYTPVGDRGHAEVLKPLFRNRYRWALYHKRWMVYEGGVWKPVSEEVVLREAADLLYNAYVADLSTLSPFSGKEEVKLYTKKIAEVCDAKKMLGVLTFLKGEEGIATRPDEWDKDPWLLNVLNGTIDLRSGELLPHRPEDLITRQAPVEYDPDATLDLWDRFLDDVTGSDEDFKAYLQRVVGYMLTGDVSEEVLFFILGPANTGKSTFVEAIKATLGNYAATADFETFVVHKNAGTPRNDIARLAGARAVFATEVERGRRLASALIKSLTGGEIIAARFLYKESFEFLPRFKLVLTANDSPRMDADDDGLWRRIIRVPFERTVPEGKRDPKVKATLRDPKEAGAAILAWAVKGCLKWQEIGLAPPERIRRATEDLRNEMNPLKDFIDACCILDEQSYTETAKLKAAVDAWQLGNGEKPLSSQTIAKCLKAYGCRDKVIKKDGRPVRVWYGIALKEELFTQDDRLVSTEEALADL